MTITQPKSIVEGFEPHVPRRRTLWGDAWRRLARNRAALSGLAMLLLLALLSWATPWLTHDPQLNVVPNNSYRQPFWVHTRIPETSGMLAYPLGTDVLGRDLLTRLLYGGRLSLIAGVVPAVIVVGIGLIVGVVAGLAQGVVDNLLMRFTDVMFAFPDLLFLIVIMSALRRTWLGEPLGGLLLMFLALSITNWPGMARLVRSQMLAVKQQPYIEAARVIGASPARIVVHHIVPNILAPLIVALSFIIPNAIGAEAALSFLGIGMTPPQAGHPGLFPTSWGALLGEGLHAINTQPWILITSVGAISLTMLAFTLVGDGLRDALDPRQERSLEQ